MAKRPLNGRSIIIYGASSGIGRATALACADARMNVAVAARRRERLEALASEVETRGVRCIPAVCDVCDPNAVNRVIEESARAFGRVDAVLANAGRGMEGSFADIDPADIRALMEVNLMGSVTIAQAAVRLFRQQKSGHLLFTSSCLSRFTIPYEGVYSASKAAQTHMARALRLELACENIEVSVVHPITTRTEFFDVAADASGIKRYGMPEHTPRWMIQEPERVAAAIVACLRSPRAEVWTSTITRLTAGLMTAFPRFHDWCVRKDARRRRGVFGEE